VFDVLVDARPGSPTFGHVESFRLDDDDFWHLYVPPGLLHGFQALTEVVDVCYRISRPHAAGEDLGVAYDDPDLSIAWPLPPGALSERDRTAGSWADLVSSL
jgi:dTDP-4-dehydrorhamnose 3,5-epimerase